MTEKLTPKEIIQLRRSKSYKRFTNWLIFLSRHPSPESIITYLDETIDDMRGYKYQHVAYTASRARMLIIQELREGKLSL
jgi:hypothetical protein